MECLQSSQAQVVLEIKEGNLTEHILPFREGTYSHLKLLVSFQEMDLVFYQAQ